ncbi:hypothetical protein VZT92_009314 [Zoarces viviparus]|uniref:Uncharacterized protein n=1 Tax=Zoarces viviparus TaxID=48416 RepID=A0AAW1FJA9_ZOAVI
MKAANSVETEKEEKQAGKGVDDEVLAERLYEQRSSTCEEGERSERSDGSADHRHKRLVGGFMSSVRLFASVVFLSRDGNIWMCRVSK